MFGQKHNNMQIIKFEQHTQLESTLLMALTSAISAAVKKYGDARILLSGGSTPLHLYELLSNEPLDWQRVSIALVDERYVSQESAYSNESQIKKQLQKNAAQQAKFFGMVYNLDDENENLNQVNKHYSPFFERIDFTLLGMGSDGHTASLFPGDLVSERLIHSKEIGVFNTNAPVFPTKRITCSKELLLKSEAIALMIQGQNKYNVLKNAKQLGLPIATLLEQSNDFKIYYSTLC